MAVLSLPPEFSGYLQQCPEMFQNQSDLDSVFDDEGIQFFCPKWKEKEHKISSPPMKRKSSMKKSTSGCSLKSQESSSSIPEQPPSASSSRRVSFADEVGQDLVIVRVFSANNLQTSRELLDRSKPKIRKALSFDSRSCQVGQEVCSNFQKVPLSCAGPTNNVSSPRLTFDQPAADFRTFMDKLQTHNISLDNVIVTEKSLFGTIKVRNICYAKEVFVRCTFNRWASYVDIPAVYVPCCTSEKTNNPIDTFSFDTTLCLQECVYHSIEFAVCMRANGMEYWDNNKGENYTVLFDLWYSPNVINSDPSPRDRSNTYPDHTGVNYPPKVSRIRRNFCLY